MFTVSVLFVVKFIDCYMTMPNAYHLEKQGF
jgi:hypothetical protein